MGGSDVSTEHDVCGLRVGGNGATLQALCGDVKANPAGWSGSELSFRQYARHVPDVVWVGDTPWRQSGIVLRPLCMPHVPIEVGRRELRQAISDHHALLACWTSDWDSIDASEWWWTCCDRRDYDLESIESARGRRSIRRGLRNCTVRRVGGDIFAELAYPIHRAAVESYGDKPPSRRQYVEDTLRLATYPGTEFWAAFYGDRMAAFSICQTFDGAVTLGSTKSDPQLDRYNPNAALFYSIARHYLQRGLRYVSNGSRTLYHPTSINEFLIRLGFRRVFCRVHVELSPVARIIDKSRLVQSARLMGLPRLAGRKWAQLEGFDRLLQIAHSFA
jgi:hypothetical protein